MLETVRGAVSRLLITLELCLSESESDLNDYVEVPRSLVLYDVGGLH